MAVVRQNSVGHLFGLSIGGQLYRAGSRRGLDYVLSGAVARLRLRRCSVWWRLSALHCADIRSAVVTSLNLLAAARSAIEPSHSFVLVLGSFRLSVASCAMTTWTKWYVQQCPLHEDFSN